MESFTEKLKLYVHFFKLLKKERKGKKKTIYNLDNESDERPSYRVKTFFPRMMYYDGKAN